MMDFTLVSTTRIFEVEYKGLKYYLKDTLVENPFDVELEVTSADTSTDVDHETEDAIIDAFG